MKNVGAAALQDYENVHDVSEVAAEAAPAADICCWFFWLTTMIFCEKTGRETCWMEEVAAAEEADD